MHRNEPSFAFGEGARSWLVPHLRTRYTKEKHFGAFWPHDEVLMKSMREDRAAADVAFSGPLIEPLVVRDSEVQSRDGGHRPPGRKSKNFGFFDKQRGIGFRAASTYTDSTRYTPRHKHGFDQIRYIISGQAKFGRTVYGPGDCLYMPEGVSYGPEDCSVSAERIGLTVQFPGPTRIPFPHSHDTGRAMAELAKIGKFEKGLFTWPDGRRQDGHEAATEYLLGHAISYPQPRYPDHVAMHSPAYPWVPLETAPGVFVKHLGYFNETGPNIKLLKLEPGACTPKGVAPCQQVRYLIEGDMVFKQESFQPISCMYFPADVPYDSTSTQSGAILLVVQMASVEGKAPPFCVI
jgi:mannose-6-phosphate isomerase-like protein (cupin superfamily)